MKFFISTVGFQPVLSEESDALYNPNQNTHGAVIGGVESCQLFILVIGGRQGNKMQKEVDALVVNTEFEEAIAKRIPVFVLIEREVYAEHFVYLKNRGNQLIKYSAVDNVRIFDFIEHVKQHVTFNDIMPFNDFTDVEAFLKTQWAELMYYFLMNDVEFRKIKSLLNKIAATTERVEFYTGKLVEDRTEPDFQKDVELYKTITSSSIYADVLKYFDYRIEPADLLANKSINNLLKVEKKSHEVFMVTFNNRTLVFDNKIFTEMKSSYDLLHKQIETITGKFSPQEATEED